MKYRQEQDSLGFIDVPENALWGAQTQRAVNNFKVNSCKMPSPVIRALGLIKEKAAITNKKLKLLNCEIADAISKAASEVKTDKLTQHFPVEIFQTGSGTSTNMNANEVIANRASQILGKELGKKHVHPNDHVNMCQSSNDVFPTALHIGACLEIEAALKPSMNKLSKTFSKKEVEFSKIVKIGRTHLQDALPLTAGQQFSGYRSQIMRSMNAINAAVSELEKLPLGGTAIGSGLNAHKEFAKNTISKISKDTKLDFSQTDNLFEGLSSKGALLRTSCALKELSTDLTKIANDIRWLSSGPRAGLGELKIPSLQPGSSIMPGKVNPVIPEMLIQICAQVIANDSAITLAAMSGNFELNVMMPLIAKNLFESIEILANGIAIFTEKCIDGIEFNEQRCSELVETSLMVVTNLTKKLGYDKAAELAKEAYEKNKTIREVVLEKKLIPPDELDTLLDLRKMTNASHCEKSSTKQSS